MQPEPYTAFHKALRFGPGHCPPDLFEGTVPAIVRGLKVHANNISHARHVALEDIYPRLVRRMGPQAFHGVAEAFLDQPHVIGRSLDDLGEGFEQLLDDPAWRDLARTEWAWLDAFHAAEGDALTLAGLGSMAPDVLATSHLGLHPAVRFFQMEAPNDLAWDDPIAGEGDILLLTRPGADVFLRRMQSDAGRILAHLAAPTSAHALPDAEPLHMITLVEAGAIRLEKFDEA